MKFLLTAFIFLIIPAILCLALVYAVFPLFFQRFFRKGNSESKIYPYQTSWEEAA